MRNKQYSKLQLKETVTKALKRGKLTIEEIAEDGGVGIDFILKIQRGLAQNQ